MSALARLCCAALTILAVTSVPIVVTTAHAQVRISVIGDSNAQGYGVGPNDAYPAKLERALRARGIEASVANNGIGGDTIARLLDRLDGAAPQGTHVAVVWAGDNDVARGATEAQVEASRRLITNRLSARGTEVIHLRYNDYYDLRKMPKYQVVGRPGVAGGALDNHLNAEGYDKVVERTLSSVVAAIRRAKRSR